MFRLMFAPKATPGKGEITILSKVFSNFNIFRIDMENKKLRVGLEPNINNGHTSYKDMIALEKEGWDIKNLNYTIDQYGNLEMDIPEGYEVLVILK